jgi:hypothetical protein
MILNIILIILVLGLIAPIVILFIQQRKEKCKCKAGDCKCTPDDCKCKAGDCKCPTAQVHPASRSIGDLRPISLLPSDFDSKKGQLKRFKLVDNPGSDFYTLIIKFRMLPKTPINFETYLKEIKDYPEIVVENAKLDWGVGSFANIGSNTVVFNVQGTGNPIIVVFGTNNSNRVLSFENIGIRAIKRFP